MHQPIPKTIVLIKVVSSGQPCCSRKIAGKLFSRPDDLRDSDSCAQRPTGQIHSPTGVERGPLVGSKSEFAILSDIGHQTMALASYQGDYQKRSHAPTCTAGTAVISYLVDVVKLVI